MHVTTLKFERARDHEAIPKPGSIWVPFTQHLVIFVGLKILFRTSLALIPVMDVPLSITVMTF